MKQVTRLKTETQLIKRTDSERAYTQALHSILFRSGKLQGLSNRDHRSNDMIRFHLSDNEAIPYQYTDTIVLIDGTTREEFYTALVMKDIIHIKISYAYTYTEKPTRVFNDEIPIDELDDDCLGMDEDEVEFEEPKGPQVLGKIDLDKCS